jgi:hypothetical protein
MHNENEKERFDDVFIIVILISQYDMLVKNKGSSIAALTNKIQASVVSRFSWKFLLHYYRGSVVNRRLKNSASAFKVEVKKKRDLKFWQRKEAQMLNL